MRAQVLKNQFTAYTLIVYSDHEIATSYAFILFTASIVLSSCFENGDKAIPIPRDRRDWVAH